jgi:hypothetical protein
MKWWIILALAIVLLSHPVAFAQAATVGPNCTASWGAPTLNSDGSPVVAGTITAYRIYLDKATVTPGVTTPSMTVSGTTTSGVKICTGLAAGNHTVSVSAVAGPNEGVATAALPFALATATPGSPSNLQVQP